MLSTESKSHGRLSPIASLYKIDNQKILKTKERICPA